MSEAGWAEFGLLQDECEAKGGELRWMGRVSDE